MALRRALAFAGLLGANAVPAQEFEVPAEGPPAESRADIHFQMTTVTQAHRSFDSPYSGRNSLQGDPEHETTVTATLFLGARLWKGAELYVNPELSGGSGLSHTVGVAGFPNGEAFRVSDAEPRVYLARAFLRQTLAAGEETEAVDEDANQLGGRRPVRRWTLTAGRIALEDLFDGNEYSHDPRVRFLNWAAWTGGAWDYAADTRGYTWGASVEYGRRGRPGSGLPRSPRSPMETSSTRTFAVPTLFRRSSSAATSSTDGRGPRRRSSSTTGPTWATTARPSSPPAARRPT